MEWGIHAFSSRRLIFVIIPQLGLSYLPAVSYLPKKGRSILNGMEQREIDEWINHHSKGRD